MYILNDYGKEKIKQYKFTKLSEFIGISNLFLGKIAKGHPCNKLMAYALTKVFDKNKEVEDYFTDVKESD